MTVERVRRPERRIGCVQQVETGVLLVLTDGGSVRASLDGGMLAAVARDRACLPGPGDWVQLRDWPDGRTTVLRRLNQPVARGAQVLDLQAERRRRRR